MGIPHFQTYTLWRICFWDFLGRQFSSSRFGYLKLTGQSSETTIFTENGRPQHIFPMKFVNGFPLMKSYPIYPLKQVTNPVTLPFGNLTVCY